MLGSLGSASLPLGVPSPSMSPSELSGVPSWSKSQMSSLSRMMSAMTIHCSPTWNLLSPSYSQRSYRASSISGMPFRLASAWQRSSAIQKSCILILPSPSRSSRASLGSKGLSPASNSLTSVMVSLSSSLSIISLIPSSSKSGGYPTTHPSGTSKQVGKSSSTPVRGSQAWVTISRCVMSSPTIVRS